MNALAQDKLSGATLLFFALFVFASTFSIAISQSALGIALVLFLVIVFKGEGRAVDRRLKWFYISAGLYVAWMVLAGAAGGKFLHSLNSMREDWLFLIVPLGIFLVHKDHKNADRLLVVLAVAEILITVYSLGLYISKVYVNPQFPGPLTSDQVVRIRGNFSHPLTFANYAGTVALFMLGYALAAHDRLATWARRLILAGGIAGVFSTLLSASRGPLASVFCGLIIMLFFLRRRKLLIGIAVFLGLLVTSLFTQEIRTRFVPHGDRTGIERNLGMYWQGSRRFVWTYTLKIIRENPVLGVGPGNFQEAYAAAVGPALHPAHRYGHAHNDLLNVTAQSGVPGGLFYSLMWLSAVGYFFVAYRRAGPGTEERCRSLAALLGSILFFGTSMTEATFADEEVRALLMFVWAIGLSAWYKPMKEEAPVDRA